jgi:hypothetical protein
VQRPAATSRQSLNARQILGAEAHSMHCRLSADGTCGAGNLAEWFVFIEIFLKINDLRKKRDVYPYWRRFKSIT